jgi:hypothetical protein
VHTAMQIRFLWNTEICLHEGPLPSQEGLCHTYTVRYIYRNVEWEADWKIIKLKVFRRKQLFPVEVTSKLLHPQNGEKHKNLSSIFGALIKIWTLDSQNKKQNYKSKGLDLPIAFPCLTSSSPVRWHSHHIRYINNFMYHQLLQQCNMKASRRTCSAVQHDPYSENRLFA